jgi:ubiquinol-cytochrome c reductase cytochrome b subunit
VEAIMILPRLVGRKVGEEIDGRLRLAKAARHSVAKIFPDHWSFMLGELALYSFTILVGTGLFLTMFFDGSSAERAYDGSYGPLHGAQTSAAYASTVEISFDVRAGLLVRQVHHWAALLFLAAIMVHLCRNFFTGSFRRPRDVNWLVGVTLLIMATANGFLGYSLPDDLLSGTGLRIISGGLLSIPVIGSWLTFLLFGGPFPGTALEQRMYATHVLIVPAAIAVLISIHVVIILRQKHTQFAGRGRNQTNVVGSRVWPTYAFRSLSLFCAALAVCAALGGLVQINPVWIWGPFHADAVTSPAQPDWYIGWVEGALRLFPPWEFRVFGYLVPAPFWPAIVLPVLTFLIMYCYPWLERRFTGDRAEHHILQRVRDVPGRVAVGVWAIAFLIMLEIGGATDLIARFSRQPVIGVVWFLRIGVLVLPVLAGMIALWVTRRLRASHAPHLADLPVAGLRRRPPRVRKGSSDDIARFGPGVADHAEVDAEDAPDPDRVAGP